MNAWSQRTRFCPGIAIVLIVGAAFPGLLNAQRSNPSSTPSSEYLSDKSPGYHFLEQLQAQAYKSPSVRHHAPRTPEETTQTLKEEQAFLDLLAALEPSTRKDNPTKALEKIRPEASKELMRQIAMRLPTRYEDPVWYRFVTQLQSQIEEVVKPEALASAPHVIFGTLPMRSVNAQIIAVPGDANFRIVAINEDLFDAAYWIIRDVVLTLDWRGHAFSWDQDYVMERVPDPNIQSRFREVLLWYLGRQDKPIEWYPIEARQQWLVAYLVTSMEMFALAHEYAHALLGHKLGTEEVAYSWLQEIFADEAGYRLMLAAQQKGGDDREKSIGFWGAQLMLEVMNILDLSEKIAKTGKMPPAPMEDPLERTILKGAVQCLGAPESVECKTFEKRRDVPTHPPLWLRVALMRETMRRTTVQIGTERMAISDALDDNWDFAKAITFASTALLSDQVPVIAPNPISPARPSEQKK